MIDRNQSFSILPSDTNAVKLITEVKAYCKQTGRTFSFVILSALHNYMRDIANGKV